MEEIKLNINSADEAIKKYRATEAMWCFWGMYKEVSVGKYLYRDLWFR